MSKLKSLITTASAFVLLLAGFARAEFGGPNYWRYLGLSSATLIPAVTDIVVPGSIKTNKIIFNDGTSMTTASGGGGGGSTTLPLPQGASNYVQNVATGSSINIANSSMTLYQLAIARGAGVNARAFFISTGATQLMEVTGTSTTFNTDVFFNAGINFGSSGNSALFTTQDHLDLISNYGTASSGTLSVWGSSVTFNGGAIGAGATLSSTNAWSARQDFIVTGATYVVRFATVNAETGVGSYGIRITSRVTLGIGADPSENMTGALGNAYSLGITGGGGSSSMFLRGGGNPNGVTTIDNFLNGVPTGRIRTGVQSFLIDTQRTQSPMLFYANGVEMVRINDDPQIVSLRPRVGISIATPKSHFQVASGSVTFSGGQSALIMYRSTNTTMVSTASESDRVVLLSTHTPDYGNITRWMVVDSSGNYQFLPSTFSGSAGAAFDPSSTYTITASNVFQSSVSVKAPWGNNSREIIRFTTGPINATTLANLESRATVWVSSQAQLIVGSTGSAYIEHPYGGSGRFNMMVGDWALNTSGIAIIGNTGNNGTFTPLHFVNPDRTGNSNSSTKISFARGDATGQYGDQDSYMGIFGRNDGSAAIDLTYMTNSVGLTMLSNTVERFGVYANRNQSSGSFWVTGGSVSIMGANGTLNIHRPSGGGVAVAPNISSFTVIYTSSNYTAGSATGNVTDLWVWNSSGPHLISRVPTADLYQFGISSQMALPVQDTFYRVAQATVTTGGNCVVVDTAAATMTILIAGEYRLDYSVSFSGDANGIYDFAVGRNGTILPQTYSERSTTNTAVGNTGGHGKVYLNIGDVIDLRVSADNASATQATIISCQLLIEYMN